MTTTRRGIMLMEVAVAGALVGTLLVVCLQLVSAAAAQRRAADQRQCALLELGNVMEQIAARPWAELTTAALSQEKLSPSAGGAIARRGTEDRSLHVGRRTQRQTHYRRSPLARPRRPTPCAGDADDLAIQNHRLMTENGQPIMLRRGFSLMEMVVVMTVGAVVVGVGVGMLHVLLQPSRRAAIGFPRLAFWPGWPSSSAPTPPRQCVRLPVRGKGSGGLSCRKIAW